MRQNGACLLSLLRCCASGPPAAQSTDLRVEVRRGPCRSRARPVAALGRAQVAQSLRRFVQAATCSVSPEAVKPKMLLPFFRLSTWRFQLFALSCSFLLSEPIALATSESALATLSAMSAPAPQVVHTRQPLRTTILPRQLRMVLSLPILISSRFTMEVQTNFQASACAPQKHWLRGASAGNSLLHSRQRRGAFSFQTLWKSSSSSGGT